MLFLVAAILFNYEREAQQTKCFVEPTTVIPLRAWVEASVDDITNLLLIQYMWKGEGRGMFIDC